MPFINSALSLFLLIPASLYGNTATLYFLNKFFIEYLYAFWEYGMFGITWLGKIYVMLYIIICIILTKWFQIFELDTYSRWCLIQCIKCIGILFILNSSTILEINWFIIIILFIYDFIESTFPSYYVHISGYFTKPTYKYIGQRKTMDQYEAEGKYYTEKALKELQQQLANDKKLTTKLSDNFYRDGKHLQSNMIKRFANGDYNGLPSLNTINKISNYNYFYIPKYFVYIGIVILLLCIISFYILKIYNININII